MAKQVAAGMMHLEVNRIIHRDLALRNILVSISDSGYNIKISDFGLSRSIESSYFKNENDNIPIKWCAPEVLQYGTHSIKSDVYSFGILLWELFSYGMLPFPQYSNNNARAAILNGEIMECPKNCPQNIYDLMKKCWSKNSQNRPTFKQIFEEIPSSELKSTSVKQPLSTQKIEQKEENYGFFQDINSK